MNKKEIITFSFAINSVLLLLVGLFLGNRLAALPFVLGSIITGMVLVLVLAGGKNSKADSISLKISVCTGGIVPFFFLFYLYFAQQ